MCACVHECMRAYGHVGMWACSIDMELRGYGTKVWGMEDRCGEGTCAMDCREGDISFIVHVDIFLTFSRMWFE